MKKIAKICGALIAYIFILICAILAGGIFGLLVAFAWNGASVLMPFTSAVDVLNTSGIFGGLTAILVSCAVAPSISSNFKEDVS